MKYKNVQDLLILYWCQRSGESTWLWEEIIKYTADPATWKQTASDYLYWLE